MDSKNSMLYEVQALYDAILLDLISLHPSISTDIERDFSRLRKAAVSVGLPFYTIALPTGSKWFDKSLSVGRLIEPRPPHFGVKGSSDRRPKLLQGLISGIFEPDGTLRSDADPSIIASMRQTLLAAKKLRMECEERYTSESVADFHEIEKSLPHPWPETWSDNTPRWLPRHGHPVWGERDECNRQTSLFDSANPLLQLDFKPRWEGLRRFSARVLSQFGQFDHAGLRAKHGPGAISDRSKSYVKYDFLYWSDRLESVFPYDWWASSDLSVPAYVSYREFPSQMHAVPKTQSGPRLIAAEPTCHQWIQQAVRGWLEAGVVSSPLGNSIDFRSQELSKLAALEASRTGDLVTVDLSSASDRLTCRLVEYLFQSNRFLLDALHACRTRANVDIYGEFTLLRKFATQGSAVIFPVQSIVYCMLAYWSVAVSRNLHDYDDILKACREVRVFGDDIVIPRDSYPVLAGLLKSCLLKVNDTKTHDTGLFRESCGMDAYAGVDVTPAYFREPYSATPESLVSVIECSNNFFKKGYWHAAQHLQSTVPEAELKLVPIGSAIGSVSLYSYCGKKLDHLRRRWNFDLHRYEYRAIGVTSVPRIVSGRGNGSLVQFFNEEPDPLLPYKSGEVSAVRLRKRTHWVW